MANDTDLTKVDLELTGRLVTSVDPTQLGKGDFQSLSNMRYTDKGIKSIRGQTKLNTSAASGEILAIYQFDKDSPVVESHDVVLTGDGYIQRRVGSAFTQVGSVGTTPGVFSTAPQGCCVYASVDDTKIWGGVESRCDKFVVSNEDDAAVNPSKMYDYTNAVQNSPITDYAEIKSRYVHFASTRSINAINIYVDPAHKNTYMSGVKVYIWTATGWQSAVSVVDGTYANNATLNQSGTISWDYSGSPTPILRYFNNILAYWYLLDYGDYSTANLITNGTFDTDLTGWSQTASPNPWAWAAGTCATTAAPAPQLWQNVAGYVALQKYQITLDVVATAVGTMTVALGGVTFGVITITKSYTFSSIGGNISNDLLFTPNVTWQGSIDNVSVRRVSYVNPSTRVYFATVSTPLQDITDIWDGLPRQIAGAFWDYSGSGDYRDYSTNVMSKNYVAGDTSTFLDWQGATGKYYFAFTERIRGIYLSLVNGHENAAAAVMTVEYWDGDAWIPLTIFDNTAAGTGTSMNQSGLIYWNPPDYSVEFQRSLVGKEIFYYYRMQTNTGVVPWIDYIYGVPCSSVIYTRSVASMFQNRLVLCNNQAGEKNTALISASGTNCVFNGSDSIEISFGDSREINSAVPFFSRFSNSFFENLFVGKPDSVWILDGLNIDTYRPYKISSMYGVGAPGTLTACDLGFGGVPGSSATRNVIIWQSAASIVMWEGSIVFPIDNDINDVFNQENSYAIEPTMISKSRAFYDEKNKEFHWLWASKGNTSLNKEYVYDLIRRKWYTVDRGTGKRLQLGCIAYDSNGNVVDYGVIAGGYAETLESGKTFDGNSIISSFQLGDIPLGGWMVKTEVRHIKPIIKAKNNTMNTLQIDYYGESASTPVNSYQFNVNDATHRIVTTQPGKPNVESINDGSFVFHSFKATMTTNNEDIGFEPIGIGLLIKKVRDELK